MTKNLYISNYAKFAAKNGMRESFSQFCDTCEEDGFSVNKTDYDNFRRICEKFTKRRRAALKEAIFLSEDNDPRSFNDIYGDQGISLDDSETVDTGVVGAGQGGGDLDDQLYGGDDDFGAADAAAPAVGQLSADDISELRSLATRILDIIGGGDEDLGADDFDADDTGADDFGDDDSLTTADAASGAATQVPAEPQVPAAPALAERRLGIRRRYIH